MSEIAGSSEARATASDDCGMSFDTQWQRIGELLNRGKGGLDRSDAESLRRLVAELIGSAGGTQSIIERFQSSDPFPGKERFLRELARVLDAAWANASESLPTEWVELVHTAGGASSPKKDTGHWTFLWLLYRAHDSRAGSLVSDSLGKVGPRNRDLATSLEKLPSWKSLHPDRGSDLLEFVHSQATKPKDVERLTKALDWQRARCRPQVTEMPPADSSELGKPTSEEVETDKASNGESITKVERSSIAEATPAESKAESTEGTGDSMSQRGLDERAGRFRDGAADGRTPGHPPAEPPDAQKHDEDYPNSFDLDKCMADVATVLEGHLGGIAARLRESIAAHEESRRLEEHLHNISGQLDERRCQLDAAVTRADELEGRVRSLAFGREQQQRQITENERQIRELSQQLTEARSEAENAERRADSYIHQANRERDAAVRIFQSKLWGRIRPYLIEVLNESEDDGCLNSDQKFLRRRLRDIRNTLTELGIPPQRSDNDRGEYVARGSEEYR